jgi:flagellar biosynthetic protein FlhB
MAEATDRESRTEEASPKRIEEALAKGNTPFSREVAPAVMLVAIGLGLPLLAVSMVGRLVEGLARYLDGSGDFRLENGADAVALAVMAGKFAAAALGPAIVCLALAGLLASGLQNPPRMVLQRIKPDFSRISVSKGFARVLGPAGRVDFLKATSKLATVGMAVALLAPAALVRMLSLASTSSDALIEILLDEVARLFLVVGLVATALASADTIWTRLKWRRDLRMSPHELKEEHKQSEGDPIVRARQRSIARNRARKRMIAQIPRATLVVANPTHYAVAMRYVPGETAAPLVIAKGVDHLALRIREIAEANDIPVIEDPALARSLYAAVKADRPIPPEFYRAVAEILLFLMSQRAAYPRAG